VIIIMWCVTYNIKAEYECVLDGSVWVGEVDKLDDGCASRTKTESASGLFPWTVFSISYLLVERYVKYTDMVFCNCKMVILICDVILGIIVTTNKKVQTCSCSGQ